MIVRALSSWPVVTQVSPQQASSSITRAVRPGRPRAADRRVAVAGEEVVGEGVRPDPDVRSVRAVVRRGHARRAAPQRGPARTPGIERRWSMPARRLGQPGDRREPHHPVRQRRHRRGQRGPLRQPAEQVVAARAAHAAATSCFWCSASDLYVAMSTPVGQSRGAALAGQAEVERLARPPGRRARRPASRRAPPGAPGRGRGWSPSRRGSRGTTGTSRRPVRCCRPRTCRRRCSGARRCRASRRRGPAAARCGTGGAAGPGAGRRPAAPGRRALPGLSRSSGSQIALTAANSRSDSASYISGSSSERARPSPCSPDSEPPCVAQLRARTR